MKLVDWFKTRRLIRNLRRQSAALDRKVDRLVKAKEREERKLDADEERLRGIRDSLEKQLRKIQGDINRARGLNQQLERQLETTMEENKGLNHLIETLMAGNDVVLDRYRTLSQIEAMKTVQVTGRVREDEY